MAQTRTEILRAQTQLNQMYLEDRTVRPVRPKRRKRKPAAKN